MALLNTYSSANRVLTQDKTITYSSRRVEGSWTEWDPGTSGMVTTYHEAWEITRRCTMHYSYVGMNLATAQRCRDALVNLFSRNTKVSVWLPTSVNPRQFYEKNGGIEPMASVAVNKTAGLMYQVDVDVNEFDQRMRRYDYDTTPPNLSSFFEDENNRSYYLSEN